MSCAKCRDLEEELERTRGVVAELWADLRLRYRMASGRFDRDPVPPLLMAAPAVELPVLERDEAA